MDNTEIRKETRLYCNESFLTLVSSLRKSGNLTEEDIAYNNALGDVYDALLTKEKANLHMQTVSCGKWVRD